jgi:hypothetical protein
MDARGFVAALTPAVTDANARERFLADPKAALAAAGLDLPEWGGSGSNRRRPNYEVGDPTFSPYIFDSNKPMIPALFPMFYIIKKPAYFLC